MTDIAPEDLHVALTYGQATGSAQMLRFITEHTEVRNCSCGLLTRGL